jgi:hypothetical protein
MLCHAYFLPESCPLVDQLVGAKTEASNIDVSIIWLCTITFPQSKDLWSKVYDCSDQMVLRGLLSCCLSEVNYHSPWWMKEGMD